MESNIRIITLFSLTHVFALIVMPNGNMISGAFIVEHTHSSNTDIERNKTSILKTKRKMENIIEDETDRNYIHSDESKQMNTFSQLIKYTQRQETHGRKIRIPSKTHACANGYKRPNLKYRMCLPGLICTFGTCSSKNHVTHFSFDCTCDRGAIGMFCEHKCCLECGRHGRCALYTNGTEFCDCAANFHGERCHLATTMDITGHVASSSGGNHPVLIIVGLSLISALLLGAVVFLFLILRERGCLTLFAIPAGCKYTQYCADSHGHHRASEDSYVVYYHGDTAPFPPPQPVPGPRPNPLATVTLETHTHGGTDTATTTINSKDDDS